MYEQDTTPGWQQPLYGEKATPKKKFLDYFRDAGPNQGLDVVDSTLPKTLADAIGDLEPKTATRAALVAIYSLRGVSFLKNKLQNWWETQTKTPTAACSKTAGFGNYTVFESVTKDLEHTAAFYGYPPTQQQTEDPSAQPFLLNRLIEKYVFDGKDELLDPKQVLLSDPQSRFLNKLASQGIETSKLRRLGSKKLNELMEHLDYRIDEIPTWNNGVHKMVVSTKTPEPQKPLGFNFGGMGPAGDTWQIFD